MYSTQLLDMAQTATTPYNQSTNTLFSPTYISGCSLWLDATDSSTISTTGNTVTQWRDKSGKGFNAVPSGGAYSNPVVNNVKWNGLQVVSFADINAEMQIPNFVIPTQSRTVFFVYQVPSAYPVGRSIGPLSRLSATAQSLTIGNANTAGIGTNSVANRVLTSAGYNNTNILIFCVVNSSTSTANNIITFNGVSQTLSVSSAAASYETTAQTYQLAIAFSRNANYGVVHNLGEVMEYAAELSTSERQQVEGYLAWKWGLQGSLPTTHPYYNNAYLPNSYPIPYFPSRMNPTSVVPTVPGFTIPTTIRQYVFNPTSISGAALWLDATDSATLIRTGTNVTQWNNKSVGTTGATTIAGTLTYRSNSTPNSLPTVITTAGGVYTAPITPLTNSVNTTFFIMNAISTPGDGTTMISYGLSGGGFAIRPLDYAFSAFRNVIVLPNTYIASVPSFLTTFFMGTSFLTTSNIGLSINGGQTSATTAITTHPYNITGFGVSYSYQTAGVYFPGNIGEVIVYSRALLTSETQQIEGYLAWKWGLQSNLPANHPYKLFPP